MIRQLFGFPRCKAKAGSQCEVRTRNRQLSIEQMEHRSLMATLDLATTALGPGTNEPPVIAGFGGQVTATQDGPAVVLDGDAMVTDVDSSDFAGGLLTVAVMDFAETSDLIEVKNTGYAADQIGVVGNTVRYSNKTIGTFAGTTTLQVTLNSNATPQSVQALLRNVTFGTTAISTLTRVVQVSLDDGDGAISNLPTKSVRVNATNVAPLIAKFGTNVTFDETYTSTLKVSPNATVTDADSDFNRATLTLTAINGQAGDFFHVPPNFAIASAVGGEGASPLVITFNIYTHAAERVEFILRSISWGTNSRITGQRTIIATLTDGDGGTSNSLSRTINVIRTKIAPEVSGFPSSARYDIPNQVFRLAPFAILGAGRMSEFRNGNLTVGIVQGARPTDRIQIVGGNSAIQVTGSNVFFSGIRIGTYTGGLGSSPLVVTFNANAYPQAARELLRRISFRTSDTNRDTRTISTTVTLEGLRSTPDITSVFVSYAPEIIAFGDSVNYQVGGAPVAFTGAVSGKPSRNFSGGRLTYSVTQNGEATDLFSIAPDPAHVSRIEVSGMSLTVNGVVFGTFSGGSGLSPFVIRFNANANSDLVSKLLNLVTWQSTAASPSLSPRTISARIVDGDGLQGLPVSKQIFLN